MTVLQCLLVGVYQWFSEWPPKYEYSHIHFIPITSSHQILSFAWRLSDILASSPSLAHLQTTLGHIGSISWSFFKMSVRLMCIYLCVREHSAAADDWSISRQLLCSGWKKKHCYSFPMFVSELWRELGTTQVHRRRSIQQTLHLSSELIRETLVEVNASRCSDSERLHLQSCSCFPFGKYRKCARLHFNGHWIKAWRWLTPIFLIVAFIVVVVC